MTATALAPIYLSSPEATAALAERLAPFLVPGDIICLEGPLGAGKTHFARSLIAALTGETDIPSPTYTLVQTYRGPACDIWHADLYRLSDPAEVAELGLSEAFEADISLIEWPDRLGPVPPALWLRFDPVDEPEARRLTLSAPEGRWSAIVDPVFSRAAAHA
ncbi:MAG: tRNA (adenosine(37)-N6)-threonylcarbamoyltransferase complex ATPase subunit type 1 TsaE [Paracoccaceae bacterium]|nr:tRNA (adenosine(37)-N6)-threonylcarbamoyltransferase complex ATPase subunit type 1 TsaE [Paracoccaceae bacterium]